MEAKEISDLFNFLSSIPMDENVTQAQTTTSNDENEEDSDMANVSSTNTLFHRSEDNRDIDVEISSSEEACMLELNLLTIIADRSSDVVLVEMFDSVVAQFGGKQILLKHLCRICRSISDANRWEIAKRLGQFLTMDNANSYRFRTEFVEQLITIAELFDAAIVNRFFSGFALTFSADRIACIRDRGIELLAVVIGVLLREEWPAFIASEENETVEDQIEKHVDEETQKQEKETSDVKLADSSPSLPLPFPTRSHTSHSTVSRRSSSPTPSSSSSFIPLIPTTTIDEKQSKEEEDTEKENGKTASCTSVATLPLTDAIVEEVRRNFWGSRSWRRRQSFGRLLYMLLYKKLVTCEQFCYFFFTDLMQISKDSVPNIRQYFCVMANWCAESRFFADDSGDMAKYAILANIRQRLKQMADEDSDAEIRLQARAAAIELDPALHETTTSEPQI